MYTSYRYRISAGSRPTPYRGIPIGNKLSPVLSPTHIDDKPHDMLVQASHTIAHYMNSEGSICS